VVLKKWQVAKHLAKLFPVKQDNRFSKAQSIEQSTVVVMRSSRVLCSLKSIHEYDISVSGCNQFSSLLSEALCLQWRHGFPQLPRGMPAFTQGFHPYIAGMNPALARLIIPHLNIPNNGCILDPFCGSGTVLIEGTIAGVKSIGVDVSPLATFVASHQTWKADREELASLFEKALHVCERLDHSSQKSELKSWGVVGHELHRFFSSPHGQQGESAESSLVSKHKDDISRLWFCVSSAISHNEARTSNSDTADLFLKSVLSYCKHVHDYSTFIEKSNPVMPQANVILGCIRRKAPSVVAINQGMPVDAVLTSPPYPGVYDYVAHARMQREILTRHSQSDGVAIPMNVLASSYEKWPATCFIETKVPKDRNWGVDFSSQSEIGAHKAMRRGKGQAEEETWSQEEQEWLRAVAVALKPGGLAGFVIGDHFGNFDGLASLRESVKKVGCFVEVSSATIKPNSYKSVKLKGKGLPPGNRRTEHFVLLKRE
jgi:DNA modification methylase